MPIELTGQQLEYLENLLRKRHAELLHELHHAVTLEFKAGLRQEIALTEQLQSILRARAVA